MYIHGVQKLNGETFNLMILRKRANQNNEEKRRRQVNAKCNTWFESKRYIHQKKKKIVEIKIIKIETYIKFLTSGI